MFPCQNTDLYDAKSISIVNKEFEIIAESEEIVHVAAELITQGNPIATCFRGVEDGPRALGHRSLICALILLLLVFSLFTFVQVLVPFTYIAI
jgi:hypothetical protein